MAFTSSARWRSRCLGLAIGWFGLTALGCANNPVADWPVIGTLFPDPDESAELARYGPTPQQRIDSVRALGTQAASASPDRLQAIADELGRRIATENDPDVRVEIINTLGSIRTPLAVAIVRSGLEDKEADVRVACCEAWGRIGGDEATAALQRALSNDTDIDVRQAAARALGQFAAHGNVQALGMGLDDKDIAVQIIARRSLREVSGRDFGNDKRLWAEYVRGGTPEPPAKSIAEHFRAPFF
jgi:HEAT repeat protein